MDLDARPADHPRTQGTEGKTNSESHLEIATHLRHERAAGVLAPSRTSGANAPSLTDLRTPVHRWAPRPLRLRRGRSFVQARDFRRALRPVAAANATSQKKERKEWGPPLTRGRSYKRTSQAMAGMNARA